MNIIEKIRNISSEELKQIVENSNSLSEVFKKLGNPYRNQIVINVIKEKIKDLGIDINSFFKIKKIKVKKKILIEAVRNSFTISSVLESLNLNKYNSGNYKRFNIWKKKYNLDTSHFLGRKFSGNKNKKLTFTLEELLVTNSPCVNIQSLKKKLIESNMLKEICNKCGLGPAWQGEKLILQLEHINGINDDNRLENLTLLCPNCHTQTKTFAGRNTVNNKILGKIKNYCICGKEISVISKMCRTCEFKQRKGKIVLKTRKIKNRPSKEQLLEEIKNSNYCAVGRKYGVSDNSIRKWLKNNVSVPRIG